MTRKLPKQTDGIVFSTRILAVSGILIFAIIGYAAVRFLYFSDSQVFWGGIGNALSTEGVTKTKDFTEQGVTRKEKISLSFSPLASQGYTESSADTGEINRSESISSKTKDYSRYIEISSNPNSPKLDLSSLIGVWTDMSYSELPESKILGDQLTNGLLVFTGNIPHVKRNDFVLYLKEKKVFTPLAEPRNEVVNGKKVKVYSVAVKVSAYNEALKKYLELLGLPETAKQVGSGGDVAKDPVFELAIEPITRTVVKAGFPYIESPAADMYAQWGVSRQFVAPKDFISTDELQKRIQALAPPTTPQVTTDETTQQ